jgi:radical SAM protein with 4Fe4S-binding SPASM domain
MYRQDPPFASQIELVEGCSARCGFCALNAIRGKENNYKFMTEDTLRSVMTQMVEAGWNPRVEFAVHGEPSMHPHLVDMVRLARECAPRYQLMITSNGSGLLGKPGPQIMVNQLFEAGLNVLVLDDYEGLGWVPRIREALRETTWEQYEYPANRDASPHTRRKLSFRGVIYVEDITKATAGVHSVLNNHSGEGAPPVDADHPSQRQRCAKPFREITVRWDGNVAICCNTFRGHYRCGNIVTDGLDAVWNGPRFDAARRRLMLGKRDFKPCQGCDALSYRVGLLPDKKGKVIMSKPTVKSNHYIEEALADGPYTAPVVRAWEV